MIPFLPFVWYHRRGPVRDPRIVGRIYIDMNLGSTNAPWQPPESTHGGPLIPAQSDRTSVNRPPTRRLDDDGRLEVTCWCGAISTRATPAEIKGGLIRFTCWRRQCRDYHKKVS